MISGMGNIYMHTYTLMYSVHIFMCHLATGMRNASLAGSVTVPSIVVHTETNLAGISQSLSMAAYCSQHAQQASVMLTVLQ